MVDESRVDMVNSFELRMFTRDGHVFPELEVVGWYCTGGDGLEEDEVYLQSFFAVAIDSPVVVKLNPAVDSPTKSRETPLDSAGHQLVEIDWTLVSEQSERIGIDHIARLSHQHLIRYVSFIFSHFGKISN
ncbi:unnamed protein product [Angiostrongylus costaricensis]|uniref:COP9 signalosome complex subunit 6 n=1 Tax=Angiostrongylus costaricensis TaxID=334426 RepID=A0A0R3PZ27_ANGCS|nr:unnamed protein product [Angiostrongylus costaricensis]